MLLLIINAALKLFTTSNTAFFFAGTAGCNSKFTFRGSDVCIPALSLDV